ncbi:MAG: DEAD/DEAH box helicase [Planctomycetaceae bacterium]|nr:MAG: DEAD/DEAH box helicase [Planctomycetaceae bacterium]
MSQRISISPAGRLRLEAAADELPELSPATAKALQAAFAKSSLMGMLYLVSEGLTHDLPASLVFWRDWSRNMLERMRQAGQEPLAVWRELEPPDESICDDLLAEAPPMRGLEYLTVPLLQKYWRELRDLVVTRAAACPDGPAAYLEGLNPLWHLLGRVTFHLAENKRDPDLPFAFLATYTHRLTEGKLRHLPLGQALREYAGANNQHQLNALLAPVRKAAEDSPLVRELLETKALFRPQAWSIPQAYRFLKEVPSLEQSGLVVRVPDWWRTRHTSRPQVRVQLGQRRASRFGLANLLDFSVDLSMGGDSLSDQERRQLLAANAGLILLRGRWVEVDPQRLQQALAHWQHLQEISADGISLVEGMRLLAGAPLDQPAEEVIQTDWSTVVAGDWLRETLQQIRNPATIHGCQPGQKLQATLRPYQAEGVRWLWFMTRLGLGACLADDMGLGKTIQVIDLLLQSPQESGKGAKARDAKGPRATSLLVVPASLIGNWRQELQRFAPQLRVLYAHRSEMEAADLQRVAADPAKALADIDLMITTYGLARRQQWLRDYRWDLVILDEAQAIKNAASAQTRAVKKIPARARIVMTGTPVENHLGDLWSIFDFCCPGLLGSARQFQSYVKRLNQQQDAHAYGSLRRLVRPYILRRLKTDPDIVPDLPAKTEMLAECRLSKKQAVLYEQRVTELSRLLQDSDGMARRGLVLATLMQLKQICNHPAQFLNNDAFHPEDSGKFQRLSEIGETIAERQEKALVFTQFQSLTQPLAEFLHSVFRQPGLVLDGKTPVRKRQQVVRQFQQDEGPPFCVISIKAGGSGLNLTAASHVIHFDRWWNPAVENQATDRAFRIGQKKNVLVHKFVCRGTLEERIAKMIDEKQNLADQILDQSSEKLLTEMSDEQLLSFVSLDLNRALTAD